jgi:RNA polymerase sigma factor (sigma-70 family)
MRNRERIILAHAPLVRQWATRYKATAAKVGIEYEDLCQAGWLGFCQGLRRWNPRKGVTVGAFIGKWVWGSIHRICIPKKRSVSFVSLDLFSTEVQDGSVSHEQAHDLKDWIDRIPGTASRIAARRLAEGKDPTAIMGQLGLSETQFKGLLLNLRQRWEAQ